MSNQIPTPLSGLTFSGTDLQRSNLSVHLEITQGLDENATVRGKDTVIPSAAGRRSRNRVSDLRQLELTGFVQGVGSTEATRLASYRNLVDELQALFALDADPDTLAGEAWDGTTRTIEARPTVLAWGPQDIPGVRKVVVHLESVDPDWDVSGS